MSQNPLAALLTTPPQTTNPRAAKAIRAVFAGTLCLEALTVLFVPRAVAQFGTGLTAAKLAYSLTLAGLLLLTAGLMRFGWALWLGTALQLAIIGSGVMTAAMYVLGIIFAAIWVYGLHVRVLVLEHYARLDAARPPPDGPAPDDVPGPGEPPAD